MSIELTKDWLLVMWNIGPGVLLRKQCMLVLDAFKTQRTPEIKAEITGNCMNTDIVVILGWMTSQLQGLGVRVNKPFKHLKQLYSESL
jgi:hypothetical protein